MRTSSRPWLVICTTRGRRLGVGVSWLRTWTRTRAEGRELVRWLKLHGWRHGGVELDPKGGPD